jgi:hypothetical protein
MSALTHFGECKAKVAAARDNGFDREAITAAFLGGVRRVDAVIQLTDAEFEDAIEGLQLLLADCANRVSAVAVDDEEAKVT